jgi:hypothetical protein
MAKENIVCLWVTGIRFPVSALNLRLHGLSGGEGIGLGFE